MSSTTAATPRAITPSAPPSPALLRSAGLAVALSFAGLWAVVLPFIVTGHDVPAFAIFLGRFIPLVASLVAWRVMRPAPLGQLWRTSSTSARRLAVAAVVAAVVMAGVDLAHVAIMAVAGEGVDPRPGWLQVVLMLVPIMLVFSISTFGEEVLWRGHLRTALESWGFWRSASTIAAAWVLFHAPLTLAYHLSGAMDLRVNLATWLGLAPVSILLCALVDRLRLVWVAVLAHAFPFSVLQQQLLSPASASVDGTLVPVVDDMAFWTFYAVGWALTLATAALLHRRPRRPAA